MSKANNYSLNLFVNSEKVLSASVQHLNCLMCGKSSKKAGSSLLACYCCVKPTVRGRVTESETASWNFKLCKFKVLSLIHI